MAETLAVLASGIAVVQLASQLAGSIMALKEFCSLIQSAPNDILLALDELDTLSMVLEDIDCSVREQVFLNPRIKYSVMRSYRLCRSSSDSLGNLVASLQSSLEKGKKRGGFKAALKKTKFEEMTQKLEHAKGTMMLANQVYYHAVQKQKWASLEQDMIELRMSHQQHHYRIEQEVYEVRSIVSQISGAGLVARPNPGKILDTCREIGLEEEDIGNANGRHQETTQCCRTQKRRHRLTRNRQFSISGILDMTMSSGDGITTTSFRWSLPTWIIARKFEINLTRSRQGWDQSLRSYRVVPHDAPIFNYCMDGNIKEVQRLFQRGQASPFEVNCSGMTPLHVRLPLLHLCHRLLLT